VASSAVVVDASAIIAIITNEPGHEPLLEALLEAAMVVVGIPTLLETSMVLSSKLRKDARGILRTFLRDFDAELIPFTQEHYEIATDAFLRYGKGRHRANLNFGDCMSYATAQVAGLPLLFTGRDFSKTDVLLVEC